jgi:carbamoyl-phosphate synthase large subunit
MRRILVTGAGGSAAANFVHSLRLADAPLHIVGVDTEPYHLELADVDVRYLVPRAGEPDYLDALNRIVEAEGIDFVHPQPDPEVAFLAAHRDEVRAATYLPTTATIALCQDKARFAAAVRDAGLPSPMFVAPGSEGELADATETVVARHGTAWVRATRGAGARASLPVTSAEQAVAWVRYWVQAKGLAVGDFMVTEFLPGREFAFQSLWSGGRLVTSQARERLRYLFGHLVPSGQTSTPSVARTVSRDDVNELAIAAIRAVDPDATGVFCADLKEDADGRPLLTEINPGRFFTTSNFLATAGLNMPLHYVRLGLGEPPPTLAETNALDEGLYWVRMIDMGYKLVREGEWSSREAP